MLPNFMTFNAVLHEKELEAKVGWVVGLWRSFEGSCFTPFDYSYHTTFSLQFKFSSLLGGNLSLFFYGYESKGLKVGVLGKPSLVRHIRKLG